MSVVTPAWRHGQATREFSFLGTRYEHDDGRRATSQDHVQIFDTTLRDGEQSPGASMNVEEKVAIARQLEQLGVDVIEAGFAASSRGRLRLRPPRRGGGHASPIVLSLARTKEADIERAHPRRREGEAPRHPHLHRHLRHPPEAQAHDEPPGGPRRRGLGRSSFAKKHLDYVEFSAEDASRSDRDYLVEVFGEVIRAGAVTLNVPDTTGYALPEQYGALFRHLIARTSGRRRRHAGARTATTTSAWRSPTRSPRCEAGARQVECTVNGIGERAGNTSMEEIVMALKTRARTSSALDTGIVTEQIYPTSRLVSQITGIAVPINKPIVGENAFAHEAGIHQDGVLKNKITYEIMRPETVGVGSNRLVLGKHSGRHALRRSPARSSGIAAPRST